MQLVLEDVDMRGNHGNSHWTTHVVDKDTGKKVGTLLHERSPAVRTISLYGGRYHAHFKSFDECVAFANGIEAAVNQMTALPESAAAEAA
jgi:hypothetical protein